MTPDRLPELSGERDQWMRRLIDAERAAYVQGYAAGRADRGREEDRIWAAQPPLRVCIVPSFADHMQGCGYGHASEPLEGDRRAAQVRQDAYDSGLLPITPAYLTEPYWEELRRLRQRERAVA